MKVGTHFECPNTVRDILSCQLALISSEYADEELPRDDDRMTVQTARKTLLKGDETAMRPYVTMLSRMLSDLENSDCQFKMAPGSEGRTVIRMGLYPDDYTQQYKEYEAHDHYACKEWWDEDMTWLTGKVE